MSPLARHRELYPWGYSSISRTVPDRSTIRHVLPPVLPRLPLPRELPVGDTTTGQAVVVDPQRDVAEYLADAEAHGLTIVKVLETHFHADFLSGHLELAAEHRRRRSATARRPQGRAEFPIETLRRRRPDQPGRVELEIRETPGHTPESISIVVYPDGPTAEPYGVLTGDTLFIGDVGRPDLLASVGVTAEELGPPALPLAPRAAADAARRDQGLPRPRRRLGVRQEPVDRDGVDDRRAAAHQLRARADERGRLRRGRHPGPVRRPALLLVRRQPQPRGARPARGRRQRADAQHEPRCSPTSTTARW